MFLNFFSFLIIPKVHKKIRSSNELCSMGVKDKMYPAMCLAQLWLDLTQDSQRMKRRWHPYRKAGSSTGVCSCTRKHLSMFVTYREGGWLSQSLVGHLLVQKSHAVNIWKEKMAAASAYPHWQHWHSNQREVLPHFQDWPCEQGFVSNMLCPYWQHTSIQDFIWSLNIHSRLSWLPTELSSGTFRATRLCTWNFRHGILYIDTDTYLTAFHLWN